SDSESNKEVPLVVKVRAQDECQAGPNPGVLTEGQAGSNPGDDAEPQPQSSHVVHAGPNLEHMDLETIDVSTQQNPKLMDEGFGDLFFNDKPFEAENEKTTAESEVESMVSVTIQQDTSVIHPMTTPVIDLTSRPDSPNVHRKLQATAIETTMITTTTTQPLPPQPQESTTDSILIKRIGELEQIMANLIQDNKHLEERLDSHGSRLYTLENLNIPQQYIFQRRTPTSTEPSGHTESPLIYVKLGLTDSDSESNKEVPLVVKVRAQDECQAGPNPGVLTEGQAGSNPGDDAE
nr:hypothetical protein [Tanacetum cinerariifolium]